jgi:hypothetical protein
MSRRHMPSISNAMPVTKSPIVPAPVRGSVAEDGAEDDLGTTGVLLRFSSPTPLLRTVETSLADAVLPGRCWSWALTDTVFTSGPLAAGWT